MYVNACDREYVWVCMCERDRKEIKCEWVCVCVCVCVLSSGIYISEDIISLNMKLSKQALEWIQKKCIEVQEENIRSSVYIFT